MLVLIRTEIAGIEINYNKSQIEIANRLLKKYSAVQVFATDKGDAYQCLNSARLANELDDAGIEVELRDE